MNLESFFILELVSANVGSVIFETVVARVNCLDKTITRFVTVSPIGLRKTEIQHIGSSKFMSTYLFRILQWALS